MKFRMHVPDAPLVAAALTGAGWRSTTGDDWSLWWERGWSKETFSAESTAPGPIYVNHIPGVWALSDKIGLHHCLTAAGNRAGSAHFMWDHLPRTYEMPFDRQLLVTAARESPETVWIAKPANGTRGEGIVLLESGDAAPGSRGWIVQEYIARPHLLEGRKYTLRLYVLVTSVVPLVAHIYRGGLVKRAAVPFTLDAGARSCRWMHLTSSAVQGHAAGGPLPPVFLDEYEALLATGGVDSGRLRRTIRRLATHTILAARQSWVQASRSVEGCRKRHFQLLGFDILIDADFKPWLLEVNAGPSIRVETPESVAGHDRERELKAGLLDDVFRLSGLLSERLPDDAAALAEFIEGHRGDFERLVPLHEPALHDHDWFPLDEDLRLSAALDLPLPCQPHVRLPSTTLFSDDGATVFSEDSHRFLALNELGAAVAVWNDDGMLRSEQCERLTGLSKSTVSSERAAPAVDSILADLWDLRAPRWARVLGLPPPPPMRLPVRDARTYAIGDVAICVRFDDPMLLREVEKGFRHAEIDPEPPAAHLIDVTSTNTGVRIEAEPLEATIAEPDAVAAALHSTMLRLACYRSGGTIAFPGRVLTATGGILAVPGSPDPENAQLIGHLVERGWLLTASEHIILGDRFHAGPAVVRGVLPAGDAGLRALPLDCVATEAGPLAALLFPRIDPGQSVMKRRIGRRAAFERLGAEGFEILRRFDAAWATALVRWLGTVDRVEVSAPSVDECADAILQWDAEP